MTEKEMNKAIFDKMLENAKDVFNHGRVFVGTYTIQEVQNLNIFDFGDYTAEYHIEVGGFSCSYTEYTAFPLLQKFARLAGEKCPKFTKGAEREAVCTFSMNVPTEAKYLANFVGKDTQLPAMMNVYLDFKNSTLCASDGHILKTVHVEIDNIVGGLSEKDYLYISPKDIKRISGHCEVKVYRVADRIATEITDSKGSKFICNTENRYYPNYLGVYPNVSRKNGYVKFEKEEAKRFAKWLEKSPTEVLCEVVGDTLKASRHLDDSKRFETSAFKLEINGNCKIDISFYSDMAKIVCESGWDGGVWFVGTNRGAIFDCGNADVTLLMPMFSLNIKEETKIEECNVPALDRHKEAINARIKAIAEMYHITLEQANAMYEAGALIVA